ncbi:hypothetical protein GCM10010187_21760 [Actinomadura coerulea]|nr:hypothetical protein GCM10010187_21760 [Actinomadura coerulea]
MDAAAAVARRRRRACRRAGRGEVVVRCGGIGAFLPSEIVQRGFGSPPVDQETPLRKYGRGTGMVPSGGVPRVPPRSRDGGGQCPAGGERAAEGDQPREALGDPFRLVGNGATQVSLPNASSAPTVTKIITVWCQR